MRRALLFAAGALLVLPALSVICLRAWPKASLVEHLEDAALGPGPGPGVMARLLERHQGPRPCLRYDRMPLEEPELLERVAEKVVALGLTADVLKEMEPVFELWAKAREAERHGAEEGAELIDAVFTDRPWMRLVLRVNVDRVFEDERVHRGLHPDGTPAFARLSPEQQAGLRGIWEDHPDAFVFLAVARHLDALESRPHVEALARAVEIHLHAHPDTVLEELDLQVLARRAGLQLEPDAFLFIERSDAGYHLRSLREALKPVAISVPEGAPRQPRVRCAMSDASVTLSREQVQRALASDDDLALHARAHPFWQDGQVQGYELRSLQPYSVFVKAGLCNGDIVTAVNGRLLRSTDDVVSSREELRTAMRVTLEVRRSTAQRKLTVRLH